MHIYTQPGSNLADNFRKFTDSDTSVHIYTQPGSNLADNFRKFTDSDTVGPDAFSQKKKSIQN